MTDRPVLAVPDAGAIRDQLQRLVLADLLGPLAGPDEEFRYGDALDRYLLGRLAPRGEIVDPDELDDLPDADVSDPLEGQPEPSAPNMPSMAPSAIGFTAIVARDTPELAVRADWGVYKRVLNETDGAGPDRVTKRFPRGGTVTVTLAEGNIEPQAPDQQQPQVVVRGRVREHDGAWLVSLFLENQQPKPSTRGSASWLFQVELTAGAPDERPVFLPRPDRATSVHGADRAEQRRLGMLYRHCPEFAVGHGVGVHAEHDTPARAHRISARTVPTAEVPATDVPNPRTDPDLPELAEVELDMAALATLADGPADGLTAALRPLVTGYRAWIDRNAEQAKAMGDYRAEAESAVSDARRAADRIDAGIDLLAADPEARRAFGFANRAMADQRVHTIVARTRRADPTLMIDEAERAANQPDNRRWRPFQLAFVLLNLPSLADPAHPERSTSPQTALADLLWFPTGGGKTEAYLGLTAFTIAIRRRQPALGGLRTDVGTAVLMRYTLRLLTIQQFERAAALLCAAELLRRADPVTWKDAPFRLGLWVGGRVTPNRTDDARDWLAEVKRARGRPARGRGTPHQLTTCPWCGAAIDKGGQIDVEMDVRRTFIECSDPFCPFGAVMRTSDDQDHRGLPVLVVDEEIYRHPPSVLIATVDKFAQLPWKGETAALFGQVTERCERHGFVNDDLIAADWEGKGEHQATRTLGRARIVTTGRVRPPDLIVQDELHLISGPLGSLVGLYETAVDRLASWQLPDGSYVRPKVIASTATVRRAEQQIFRLFHRATAVFPPAGVDVRDNFFARQRPAVEKPGRRYVGICAHGVRIKSALIRVYVSVLGAAQKLHDRYGRNEVTDPYMTLVGYFNSLRDLGGMRRLVEDDVSTRLARADARGLARRLDPILEELTSRRASEDIRPLLDKLELSFGGHRRKGAPRPIDVLLATNMVAVGVDVQRLGLMVVTNQPKSTAEYIQATSRVGRQSPGIVFTVLNWARPRDLSHYETFEHFHETFYRGVEALSVTPFAERAIDRGLTGVLVSLVRNLEPTYNGNRRAQDFDRDSPLADHVVGILNRRAEGAADRRVRTRVEDQLEHRLDTWHQERFKAGRRIAYETPRSAPDVNALLRKPEEARWGPRTAPTSLRDVEPGVQLMLLPPDPSTGPAFRRPGDPDGGSA